MKGKLIKALKEIGVRDKDGRKLEHLKTYEVEALFDKYGLNYKDLKFFKS